MKIAQYCSRNLKKKIRSKDHQKFAIIVYFTFTLKFISFDSALYVMLSPIFSENHSPLSLAERVSLIDHCHPNLFRTCIESFSRENGVDWFREWLFIQFRQNFISRSKIFCDSLLSRSFLSFVRSTACTYWHLPNIDASILSIFINPLCRFPDNRERSSILFQTWYDTE